MPEPASFAVLGVGILGLVGVGQRRGKLPATPPPRPPEPHRQAVAFRFTFRARGFRNQSSPPRSRWDRCAQVSALGSET
jgi:hypothetical protein